MSTADRLARDLEAAGAPPAIVDEARRGFYDDYRSELAAPISQLVWDCRRLGLLDIAKRAEQGDYDGTKEEADAWARTSEGRAATRMLR